MLIELNQSPISRTARWIGKGVVIKKSRPFITSDQAVLTHRVRKIERYSKGMTNFGDAGTRWDTIVTMECGQKFFFNFNDGQGGKTENQYSLLDVPTKLVCLRCENRVEEQGGISSDELVGCHVHKGVASAIQSCCTN